MKNYFWAEFYLFMTRCGLTENGDKKAWDYHKKSDTKCCVKREKADKIFGMEEYFASFLRVSRLLVGFVLLVFLW
jgi:hypothetical protein